MPPTIRIITRRVGEGGAQFGTEVKRVKQLLKLNGAHVTLDGRWDTSAARALVQFREKTSNTLASFPMIDGLSSRRDGAAYVMPGDPVLFELAYRAGVLIRLDPPLGGSDAFLDVHEWLVKKRTGFDFRRVVFGWEGLPSWAVVMTLGDTKGQYEFANLAHQPLELNCTLYANLMMSVWLQGNVHAAPFRASIAESGDTKHLAVFRYHYRMRGAYSSVEDVQRFTEKHPGQLFCIEAGEQVSHMALLLNGDVFQCNVFPFGCSRQPLSLFVKRHQVGWVSGPAPSRMAT